MMDNEMKNQYGTTSKLLGRIALHEKYSRNRQPFYEWIRGNLPLKPGTRVLELGCGTGALWRETTLPEETRLTLIDQSEAMIQAAKESTRHLPEVTALTADARELPFADASFDLVIASMVLHFIPETEQAVRECRRVLKPGGTFCAVTMGERGHNQALAEMLNVPWQGYSYFTLENGEKMLRRAFASVRMVPREDALDVTDLRDIVAYLRTLPWPCLKKWSDEALLDALNPHMRGGVLSLPKAYGMFLAQ